MPMIETTLHASYQRNEWHLKEAVREIISNALDGQERHKFEGTGKMTLTYTPTTRTLVVQNDGITVPTKALLLGTSDSREDNKCIGQFGEGLPMALLVMARKGLPVTIYNGGEKWEPLIVKSSTFSDEPVLAIKTRQMINDRHAFIVEMHDIEPEEAQEIKRMFLALDEDYDEELTVRPHAWSEEAILLGERHRGRVYSKGVFVMQRSDLLYGYNLELTLNRDRHMVEEHDLRSRIGGLLNDGLATKSSALFDNLVREVVDGGQQLETQDAYSSLVYNQSFCEAVWEHWQTHYGVMYPAESSQQIEELAELGVTGLMTSPLVARIIRNYMGTIENLRASKDSEVLTIYPVESLLGKEQRIVRRLESLFSGLFSDWRLSLRVVDFGGKPSAWLRDPIDTLDIARDALQEPNELLPEICRVLATMQSKDWEASYSAARHLEVLTKVITHTFSWE